MLKILVATHNSNKRRELKTLLKQFRGIRIMTLDNFGGPPLIIVEDGRTFRQNAVKKAVTVSRFFDGLVLADDSGLEVDALDGKPGIRSARFSRVKATDEENNKKLLKLLDNVPPKERGAQFVCHVALARDGMLLETFEGVIKGHIALEPKGRNGFGYDPVFLPKGNKKTFAQLSVSYKNRVSHRALALKKFKQAIRKYLKTP
ncbi:MAG: non-canonical purine NTP pyrophosphatase, RdgB/HAM1 family [Candidatus Makaraimicrobium thalassicum]|nr:MAG: non-canonical purine NTP pyrophosphatase, RdgB/HAM1 family [Candidatus Omnitrophota bacterium]